VSAPALSVVIPAFNEERRLPGTLGSVVDFLRPRGTSFEVLVVDDGSTDGTASVVRAFADSSVHLVEGKVNRGKGHAVRTGMLQAAGLIRLMTDADLSTPMTDLPRLEEALDRGFDIAIGSRALAGSNVEVRQGAFREGMGRVFNLGVRLLLLPDLHDTQCGFKLFTAEAARAAFSGSRLEGFSFDVEALVVARQQGVRIAEVPVTWRNDVATRVGLAKGAQAFADLLRIRWSRTRATDPR
jgi:dolichyl-phosphate beta-glucosyltransferase